MKQHTLKALLFGLALLGLGMTAYHRPTLQAPTIQNNTKALEVVSLSATGPLTPTGKGYELVLRNVSAKNINGYSIGLGKSGSVTNDLTSAFRVIAPGDQFTEVLPQTEEVVIRDVIFDDDSIDGDPVAAAELQDRREGMREQLERIAPLLNAATASADIEQLKVQLRTLPEEPAAGRSIYVAAGMRNAKEDTLRELEKLDQSNVPAGLTKLAEHHNKRMMKLSKRSIP